MKILATWLLCAAMLPPVFAQPLPLKQFRPFDDGINGLLVNSVITAEGMIFYQSFLNVWREKSGVDKFNIEIAERSSRRRGNQIYISFGQKRIFFSALPIQRDRIRLLGEQAADACYANLITLSLPFKESKDPDISEDEV